LAYLILPRATTHTDLVLRARELSIPTRSIPNASILTSIGTTGLQLYNFGQTVSMVFFLDNWKPASFYDRIKENVSIGLHTLVLLDIKVKEQSLENMARGRKIYEPPRYMTVAQCAQQMLEIEEDVKKEVCTQRTVWRLELREWAQRMRRSLREHLRSCAILI
jgi:diphthine synthase